MSKRRPGLTFSQAIARMREGKVLRLEYFHGLPRWEIGGLEIASETTALLLACASIEPCNDALIPDMPAQTWRFRADATQ